MRRRYTGPGAMKLNSFTVAMNVDGVLPDRCDRKTSQKLIMKCIVLLRDYRAGKLSHPGSFESGVPRAD